MRSGPAVVTGIFAVFLGIVPGPARVQAQKESKASSPIDFSGIWIFNSELSDDARDKMREVMQGPPGAGRGGGSPPMGPGGGSVGGPGGGVGGPGGGMDPGGMTAADPREAMRALFEPAEEISITQTPTEIEVDETYGRLRRFRPNGKKYKTENGTAEMKSEWKDGLLRVETERGRGAKEVETFELSPDGNRLTVRVRLGGGRMPETILTRIYDRGEKEDPEADSP